MTQLRRSFFEVSAGGPTNVRAKVYLYRTIFSQRAHALTPLRVCVRVQTSPFARVLGIPEIGISCMDSLSSLGLRVRAPSDVRGDRERLAV